MHRAMHIKFTEHFVSTEAPDREVKGNQPVKRILSFLVSFTSQHNEHSTLSQFMHPSSFSSSTNLSIGKYQTINTSA